MSGRTPASFIVAVKLLAFAAALADAAKDADPLLMPDHVVDHLGQQDRLAHARASEQARLAAALQRHEHVDDLDPGRENFRPGGTPGQLRRSPVNGAPLDIFWRLLPVDGVSENIEHPGQNPLAHRRFQRPARIDHRLAPGQALGGGQRNSAHPVGVELDQHLDGDLPVLGLQHGVDGRQASVESDIHHAAAHRDDHA